MFCTFLLIYRAYALGRDNPKGAIRYVHYTCLLISSDAGFYSSKHTLLLHIVVDVTHTGTIIPFGTWKEMPVMKFHVPEALSLYETFRGALSILLL